MANKHYLFKETATVAVLLSSLILTTMVGCSGNADGGAERSRNKLVPAVEATQARYGSLPLTQRLSGLVKARNQVELYPEISAVVAQVYVQNGDLVESGEPLLRLQDTRFQEQLKQAEASYQIALAQAKQAEAELIQMQARLKRNIDLSEKDLISADEFEDVQTRAIAAEANADLANARVEQAQAAIDERREQLSRTVIMAPVDGTIGNRNAEIGMLVTPNTRLFTLGQLDSVRVEVVLTDVQLSYIEQDQPTEIFSKSLQFGSVTGSVSRISPFLHPVTHSTIAEIDLANPDGALRPGMFVAVDIHYGESEQATLVPLSALWENLSTSRVGVYVSRDREIGESATILKSQQGGGLTNPVSFEFIPVEVLASGRMSAGISGIEQGSWVVTIGHELMGADSGLARVRPIRWERVEELQQLQREDLLEEIMQRQQGGSADSTVSILEPIRRENSV
jgi:RND family efflux transporter MFP subunit